MDPNGQERDLLSFAAIPDELESEVAGGHDRTIIDIKYDHLYPDRANLAALYASFGGKRHPYYEHRFVA